MSRQIILITGASSGIGFETAKMMSDRGHIVIATAPNESNLKDVPNNAAYKLVIDICDYRTIDIALATLSSLGVEITCLINNAGYAQPGPIELVDDVLWRKQFDVNVFGTLAVTRACLPVLHQQASKGRDVRIITMSSMLGRVSLPFQGVYAASKHALEAAFDALRMELSGSGIHVSLIEPGWIFTPFLQTAFSQVPHHWFSHGIYGDPLSKYLTSSQKAASDNPKGAEKIALMLSGTPLQVASAIVGAVESPKPKARYPVTGMSIWMPRLASLLPTKIWDAMHMSQFTR